MRRLLLIAAASVMASAGCQVGPSYKPPLVPIPDEFAWTNGHTESPPSHPAAWWTLFNDPVLNTLITQATANNFNLRIAAERIDQYRAQYGVASADLYPDIGALANYSRNRVPTTDFGQTGSGEGEFNQWNIGLDATWEVDLFGRISRSIEAAVGDLQAEVENWRYAMITLRAEVASSYLSLRTLQARLEVGNQNIEAQQRFVEIIELQIAAGTETASALAQAQAQLAQSEAIIPQLGVTMATETANLALLLGTTPGPLTRSIPKGHGLPAVPTEVAIGIPADLLRRRPDVRAAERELAAATARIGQATADLYPKLSLSGSFGFGASQSSDLLQWASRSYSVGPSFSWDIFNGGRVRAVINQQESLTREALLTYEKTVIQAIGEVESSLVGFVLSAHQRDDLKRATASAQLAYDLSLDQYEHGVIDFLEVILVQQSLLEIEDSLAQSQGLCAETMVELYRSIGGGWTTGTLPTLASETKDSSS
jgi:NodT family efflux transporter outer membrane factor (OMF) lipoprotein